MTSKSLPRSRPSWRSWSLSQRGCGAPVTYQSWPDALLPLELQDANPLGIPRRVDGVLVVD